MAPAAPHTSSRCRWPSPHLDRHHGDPAHRRRRRGMYHLLCVSMMTIGALAYASSLSSSPSLVSDPFGFLQPVAASSVFVGPGGFIVDAPLSLEETDVGSALASLQAQLTSQAAAIEQQAERIAVLESDLTATNAIVAAQAKTIAALTVEVAGINSTVSDISDLTGETTIVIVVNGLRRLTSQLSIDVTNIDGTIANQTSALASLASDLTSLESLTGDSNLVTTVTSLVVGLTTLSSNLSSTTARLTAVEKLSGKTALVEAVQSVISTADEIGSLTGTGNIVAAVSTIKKSIAAVNDSVNVLASTTSSEIAALQTSNQSVFTKIAGSQAQARIDEAAIVDLQSSLAPGLVSYFHSVVAPPGWLVANGSAVSRITYAALFAVVNTTYGVGDGVTTFGLPDLRAEFLRGLDAGRGIDANRTLGSYQAGSIIPRWIGQIMSNNSGSQEVLSTANMDKVQTYSVSTSISSGGVLASSDHQVNTRGRTRPRNIALLACIRY